MGAIVRLQNSPIGYREELMEILPGKDFNLMREILEEYHYELAGAKRNTAKTVRKSIQTCQRFVAYCGKAPWLLTTPDYNRWCSHIGQELRRAMSTQRLYQGLIHNFYEFLKDSNKRSLIEREYGVKIRQIARHRIPHLIEDETKKLRTAVPEEEACVFFEKLDEEIAVAQSFCSKDYYPLMRDYAMFYLTYRCGLRADEVIGVDADSFTWDPTTPEYGRFSVVIVLGKGSHGSDKKRREVPIDDPYLVEILDWYEQAVRPRFLEKAAPGEQAFFMSERGDRISYSSFLNRFHHAAGLARLDGKGYTPHCFRHSSISEKSTEYTLETVRRMHGHVYASTTQRYTTLKDDYLRKDFRRGVDANLEAWKAAKAVGAQGG
jgi:site-specific recombinase XerD